METIKREVFRMDFDWLFHRGDLPKEKITEHMYTYDLCKTTRGHGAASVCFTDEDWEHVQLPHDFLIEGEPSGEENGIKGSYPRPNAWYRKYFRLEDEDRQKRLTLSFEGVATHSVIYLNGHLIYRSFSGYTGFEVDISDFCRYGDELNVLAVYIKNHESEGWWYEGAGIYRHVDMIKTGGVSVDTWGTFVRGKKNREDLWDTLVDTQLRNDLYDNVEGTLVSTVLDADGNVIGKDETSFKISARSKTVYKQNILAVKPKLWSCDAPNMHTLYTQVIVGGELTDDYCTPFGYRTLRYDPDEGFFLNDTPMKIKGLCVHQDHGGLGSAVPDSVQAFRVERLKGCGANALRSTHNPASPALLDACDRLGMMVMDENRWLVSSEQRMHELESMILRGRNHPSIIFWSVFNEDPILEKPAGSNMFHAMHALAEKLDDTRAIIGAPVRNVGAEDYIRSSEVMGFNYNFDMVDTLHRCWHKPHVNTETHQGNYTGGNDGWRLAALRPYVMGIFCWGIETRGETYWPRLYAPWGIMDGLCYPKIHYELYKNSYWVSKPSIKIVPMLDYPRILDTSPCWLYASRPRMGIHWNPKNFAGKTIDIWVYTNTPRVELLLNGESLGVKYADPFEQVCWHVPYQQGELTAIGMDADGREIVRDVLCTASEPVALRYSVYNEKLKADGEDCAVITAYAVDRDGRFVADADGIAVHFEVASHGTLLAVANNEPTDHHNPKDPDATLWNGMCQVIVRSDCVPGDLVLRAHSDLLGDSELVLETTAADDVHRIANADSCYISSVSVGNYFEALDDPAAADSENRIVWQKKRLDKRLFTDMPVGYNVLPYKLEVTVPDDAASLYFEHLIGRLHIQIFDGAAGKLVDFRDENTAERITLKMPDSVQGKKLTIYIATEIDPPTYHGPNPYWRFIGMYGIARWLHQ